MKVVKGNTAESSLKRLLTSVAERAIRTGSAKTPTEFGDMCMSIGEQVFAEVLYKNAKAALSESEDDVVTQMRSAED